MKFCKMAVAMAAFAASSLAAAATVSIDLEPGSTIQTFQLRKLGSSDSTFHTINFNLAPGYLYDLSVTLSSSHVTLGKDLVSGFDPQSVRFQDTEQAIVTHNVAGIVGFSGPPFVLKSDTAAFNLFNLGPASWQVVVTGRTVTEGLMTGTVDVKRATAITAVPEPEAYAMVLAGLGMVGLVALRRRAA